MFTMFKTQQSLECSKLFKMTPTLVQRRPPCRFLIFQFEPKRYYFTDPDTKLSGWRTNMKIITTTLQKHFINQILQSLCKNILSIKFCNNCAIITTTLQKHFINQILQSLCKNILSIKFCNNCAIITTTLQKHFIN